MRISAIDSFNNRSNVNYNNNPSFGTLIKNVSVLPIIEKLSERDRFEFNQIEERLSKSKFWDLKISSIGSKFEQFKFHFINKHIENDVLEDGIHPYNLHGKSIDIYSIVYGPENVSSSMVEKLNFKSEERAKELYDEYQQNVRYARNRGYSISPVESLKMKEVELKMLEEAHENALGERDLHQLNSKLQFKNTVGKNVGLYRK